MVLMGINPHRLADRIIANIPAFDISHNKAEFSVFRLSAIHLTFDKGGKCGGAKQGMVRFWKGWCKRRMVVRQSLRLDGKKFDKSKRWTYRKQKAIISRLVACRQSTSL